MAKEQDVVKTIELALSSFGRLDGAFNNAGVSTHSKAAADLQVSDWDGVLNVNARGVFFSIKHEIRAMQQGGGGAIVNNSSIDGVVAIPRWLEYTASKHAVYGLTRGASAEAGSTHVRVNAVLPVTCTPQFVQNRI